MRDRLTIVGQLPPPVTGFSYITGEMCRIAAERLDTRVFDIAPEVGKTGLRKHLGRIARVAAASFGLVWNRRSSGRVVYVACEGLLGLYYTLWVVGLVSLLDRRIFLHHHNYTYINRPMLPMRLIAGFGGRIRHVFLCERMRDDFERAYGPTARPVVLSNAAFVADAAGTPRQGPLTIGHLSNLTREKGLHLFLDLVEAARREGLEIRAILAGPIAGEEDRRAVAAAIERSGGGLEYRGPLYGADKDRFYGDIDVFVFPTRYANEAQPTVIFEAQAQGRVIVSFDRGCIAPQLHDHDLLVADDADFVATTLDWLRHADRDGLRALAGTVAERHRRRRSGALEIAHHLFDDEATGSEDPIG